VDTIFNSFRVFHQTTSSMGKFSQGVHACFGFRLESVAWWTKKATWKIKCW